MGGLPFFTFLILLGLTKFPYKVTLVFCFSFDLDLDQAEQFPPNLGPI